MADKPPLTRPVCCADIVEDEEPAPARQPSAQLLLANRPAGGAAPAQRSAQAEASQPMQVARIAPIGPGSDEEAAAIIPLSIPPAVSRSSIAASLQPAAPQPLSTSGPETAGDKDRAAAGTVPQLRQLRAQAWKQLRGQEVPSARCLSSPASSSRCSAAAAANSPICAPGEGYASCRCQTALDAGM